MAENGIAGKLLAPADTSWWHMEQRDNQMTITAVMVIDGHLDFEHLHYIVATRLLKYDRFRQRIEEPDVAFAQPRWVLDRDFSVSNHLKRTAVARPGGRRELETLVGQ
ncbi:MAG TPA: wax ester/triacylglycerol synthase domain-containing protein, partial [Longimicrobiales bacterium]